MKNFMLRGLIVLLVLPSCRKKDNAVPTPPYTAQLCIPHKFHCIASGYNPVAQMVVTDSSDAMFTPVYNNAGAVTMAGFTLKYVDTSLAGIVLYSYSDTYAGGEGNLYFDHKANTILLSASRYVSAAGGTWNYTYNSY